MTEDIRVRVVRLSGWKVLLVAGAAALVLAALLFLTLLLVVVPIALIAGALFYLFGGRRPAPTEVIEGEYRVVEPREIERGRDGRTKP